jgi:hypothetical protein
MMHWSLAIDFIFKRGKPENRPGTHRIERCSGGKVVHSTKNPVHRKNVFSFTMAVAVPLLLEGNPFIG